MVLSMNENKRPGIIENSVVDRVLPVKSTYLSLLSQTEIPTVKSECMDDDVKTLVGEVYAGK